MDGRVTNRPEGSQALEHGVDVGEVGVEREHAVDVDARGQLVVATHQRREIEILVPGPHRVSLHATIGVVPRQPALDERQEQPLAEVKAVARIEILTHAPGPDDEPLDEPC